MNFKRLAILMLVLILAGCGEELTTPTESSNAQKSDNWIYDELGIEAREVPYVVTSEKDFERGGSILIHSVRLETEKTEDMDAAIAENLTKHYLNYDAVKVLAVDSLTNAKTGFYFKDESDIYTTEYDGIVTKFPGVGIREDAYWMSELSPDRDGVTIRNYIKALEEAGYDYGRYREKTAFDDRKNYGDSLQFFATIDGADIYEFDTIQHAEEGKKKLEDALSADPNPITKSYFIQNGYIFVWVQEPERYEDLNRILMSMTP